MDIRKVKKLIEMLENSELEEIEIQEGEESVRLVKKQSQNIVPEIVQKSEPDSPKNELDEPKKEVSEENVSEKGEAITSPMVGTFYSAASPGTKPFVSVGDEVQEGDVVCIVEAMKMMNEIKSDFSGKVTSILVENSQPVEFGQSLFIVE
ncbi:MAG: acetyl-CoA carboxylase biotin carboxyl carrier protein [Gammaproteobacteria bacterium]|nr:MAG: acetyl-CoA carboxylase biotin carboxyl carrier protein [Gammaproteobacteria bacterium]